MLKCQKCQPNKHKHLSISMDLITGLPITNCGHNVLWVVVDTLTKLIKFIPTKKDVKTPKLARLFIEHLYRLYGLLAYIVFDRARKLYSHIWREVFKNLDTTLSMSMIDHL